MFTQDLSHVTYPSMQVAMIYNFWRRQLSQFMLVRSFVFHLHVQAMIEYLTFFRKKDLTNKILHQKSF